MFADHVQVVRGNGQALGVCLCHRCGKLFGFNPQSVPTVADRPLCRQCIEVFRKAGTPEIVIEPGAYEAAYEAADERTLPEREASLPELRERLAAFREAYEMCQYIDHYPDVVRCRQLNQVHIDRLTARIAQLESQDDAAA